MFDVDKDKRECEIKYVDHNSFKAIVDYMLSGNLLICEDDRFNGRVLEGAKYLNISELILECELRRRSSSPKSFAECIDNLRFVLRNGRQSEVRGKWQIVTELSAGNFARNMPDILEAFKRLDADVAICNLVQSKYAAIMLQNIVDNHTAAHYEVIVRTLCSKNIAVRCTSYATVEDLKGMVYDKEGIYTVYRATSKARLIFKGEQLDDRKLLGDYGVVRGSVMHLVLRMVGCLCSCSASKQADKFWEKLENDDGSTEMSNIGGDGGTRWKLWAEQQKEVWWVSSWLSEENF